MSTKGRVLIANSLMMSIPRYALKFLPMNASVKTRLEKAYFKLIWEGKKGLAGMNIGALEACLPINEGGLGCQNLDSIIEASTISAVTRYTSYPNLL